MTQPSSTPSPKIPAAEFINHIVTSGLLERDEVDRLLAGFPPTEKGKTVARHLVEAGKLTLYQASRLLYGKTDGFQLGQYRILEEIGRGGMGRVFKAVHQTMGRFVALKVLAPSLTKTDRARELFQREVRSAAKLTHPNIVTAYDANQAGDRIFLVMEYVDGPNLSQLIKDRGRLPIDQACEYIRQTAVGLDYAHELGLVHRDVKPANLLVQQTSGGPQIKILDFGLAIVMTPDDVVDAQHTAATSVPGTPDYISPEQARDHRKVDGRADLYSLGCTFYYLLTGEVPFPGGTALEKVMRHGSEAPIAVQTHRPEIPDTVASVVHKLLAKNAVWRYQKGSELAADLTNVLAGKRADWSAPARPRTGPTKSEAVVSLGSGEDAWDQPDLDDQGSSTVPSAFLQDDETRTSWDRPKTRKRIVKRRKLLWPWVVLAILMAFGVVTGVGLLVRAVMNQG